MRRWIGAWAALVLGGAILLSRHSSNSLSAQGQVSATPARVTLPDVATVPAASDPLLVTETPTRTPTPETGVFLEATGGEVNVRAEPSTDAERLGRIQPGERYLVRGRYFSWLQFEYPNAPNGLGWVFGDLVTIIGDETQLDDLTLPTATTDLLAGNPLQTPLAGTEIVVNSIENLAGSGTEALAGALPTAAAMPTFTYPPNVVAQAPTEGSPISPTPQLVVLPDVSEGVAPIVPIVILGIFGLLGLIFSLTRGR
jgi:Bacterial SH3 domain